jgi:nickel/cobalt transporter (NicO) family protein
MNQELALLALTAAAIGATHTLLGPDHYVPFIAMSKAGGWKLGRTLGITAACGVGHVLSSVALAGLGVALGWAMSSLRWFEAMRGQLAGWLFLGFGLAYTAWGVRRAIRNRPHSHWHHHQDGTLHHHEHGHHGDHAHVHEAAEGARQVRRMTPWILFTIFIFGPCEPLIPLLMMPAARGTLSGVGVVTAVFAAATIATMLAVVAAAYQGLSRLPLGALERYSHALAGLALVACGVAIQLGL